MWKRLLLNCGFYIFVVLCGTSYAEYPHQDVCPSPVGGRYASGDEDNWGFYKCECVSYVAYKLNANGIVFSNSYGEAKWSDGGNWGIAADQAGVSKDKNPQVGDVAYWIYDWTGNPSIKYDDFGHVAYVEKVNGDGTVDVSEYNWDNKYAYGKRESIPISGISGFIHFNKSSAPIPYIKVAEGNVSIYWTPVNVSCINASSWCYGTCSKDHTGAVCYQAYSELKNINLKYLKTEWYYAFFGNQNEFNSVQKCSAD